MSLSVMIVVHFWTSELTSDRSVESNFILYEQEVYISVPKSSFFHNEYQNEFTRPDFGNRIKSDR